MPEFSLISDFLPPDSPKRVGVLTDPLYITIHETETGHELSPASFCHQMYHDKLLHEDNPIGYHFMVEANYHGPSRVYQFLETTVSTAHTGDHYGNQHSIGIERLVNVDTDMERGISVQAVLTAQLMRQYDTPLERVVPHHHWSGKDCPSRLLAGQYGGWDGFIAQVSAALRDG